MGKGTGLGLATVYGIVKQSGGYVWVDSEPNKGASFQIFLPRVAEISQSQAARPYVGENLRGSETILLVEDAEAIRKLAAEFLSSHGFEVLSASNAEEVLRMAAAHAGAIQLFIWPPSRSALRTVEVPQIPRLLRPRAAGKWTAARTISVT